MKRYLHPTEEKVLQINENRENCTVYIGRVLVSRYGVMVYKEDMRCFITWQELRLIQEEKPDDAMEE